jgi:small-conductance mechanosensitive channel
MAAAAPAHPMTSAVAAGVRTLVEQSWQWLVANSWTALVGLAVAVGLYLLLTLFRHFVLRSAERAQAQLGVGGVVRGAIGRTKEWFLAILALELVANAIGLPPLLRRLIDSAFIIAAALQGAIWARAFVMGLIRKRADATGREADTAGLEVVQVLVTALAWIVAAVVILDNLGANVTALVAGLGVGGIAIGLAAQGIVKDLFAALSILFDKPFSRGDTIGFGEVQGTVENIGLKTTRVRALTGEEVVVSNANLLDREVRNFSRLPRRRFTFTLAFPFYTSADRLAALPAELRALVEARPALAHVWSGFTGFGPSSLSLALNVDVLSEDFGVLVEERHQLAVALLRRLDELGVELAFPTQAELPADARGRPQGASDGA